MHLLSLEVTLTNFTECVFLVSPVLWCVFLTWKRKPGWCPHVWVVRPEQCLSCPCCKTAVGTECSPSLDWYRMGLSHCAHTHTHTHVLSSTIIPQSTDKGLTKSKQKGHYSGKYSRSKKKPPGEFGSLCLFFGHRLHILVVGVQNNVGHLFNWAEADVFDRTWQHRCVMANI